MSNSFLIQINQRSYRKLIDQGLYENDAWSRKNRDRAQGEVQFGDTLLFYCTGDVPGYSLTLAFSALVDSITPDQIEIGIGDIRWFKAPLPRDRILELVNNGELEEAFQSCGAQGFNITILQPQSVLRVLQIVDGEQNTIPRSGPLDGLVETKLEEYIVQHWSEIDFGSRLALYSENGEPVGQQYDTREIGRIDLLCTDKDRGDFVVIELKKGRPSDEVVGQLARYMGWVNERLAEGQGVRGIVLAPDFDAKLRFAAKAIPGVTLLRYQIRFEIHPEISQPK